MQQQQSRKTIIHIQWDLQFGGAHVSAVNLANEQAKHHNVILVNLNPQRKKSSVLVSRISPKVKIVNLEVSRLARSITFRIGNFISGLEKNSPLITDLMALKLTKLIKGADIVHTHLMKDRFIVSKALKMMGKNAPKHVMTDHGGFFALEKEFQKTGKPARWYNDKIFDAIVASSDCVVTITDQQNTFWQEKQNRGYRIRSVKIYNGSTSEVQNPKTREELRYRKEDFIFILVARGEAACKGWAITVDAFLKNNDPDARLILVGAGSEIERLKKLHGNNPKIKFTGMVSNPADWIHIADVGVLPSTCFVESLPNTIIEYLKEGKPVIGSDIGEVKNMLQIGKEEAGILLPIVNDRINVDLYAAAMRKMQQDKVAYTQFQRNTANASKEYDMAYCSFRYATEAYGFDASEAGMHKEINSSNTNS